MASPGSGVLTNERMKRFREGVTNNTLALSIERAEDLVKASLLTLIQGPGAVGPQLRDMIVGVTELAKYHDQIDCLCCGSKSPFPGAFVMLQAFIPKGTPRQIYNVVCRDCTPDDNEELKWKVVAQYREMFPDFKDAQSGTA